MPRAIVSALMRATLLPLVVALGCVHAPAPPPLVAIAPVTATPIDDRARFTKQVVSRKHGKDPVANVEYASFTIPASNAAATKLTDRLRAEATAEADAFAVEFAEAARSGDFGVAPWSLDVTLEVPYVSDDLLVVVRETSTYMGGAHPNHQSAATTYALQNEFVPLSFEAAFRPGAAARLDPVIMAELRKQEAGWVVEGSLVSVATMLHTWYPAADGLHFDFDPYEAGPYVEGGHAVVLPWSVAGAEVAGPLVRFVPGG